MFERRINFVLEDSLYALVLAESERRRISLADVVREKLRAVYQPTPSQVPPVPEDKNLAAFEAEQEAQRREFYKRPGTMPPGQEPEGV